MEEAPEALDAAQASFGKAQSGEISTTPRRLAEAYLKYKSGGPLWELPISRASALKRMLNGFERAEKQCPGIPELNEAIKRNRADYHGEIDGLKKRFSDNTLELLEKDYRQEKVDVICEALLDFENLLLGTGKAKKFMDALSFNPGEIKDTKRKIDALMKKDNIRLELRKELKKEKARLAALERLPTFEIDPVKSLMLYKERMKRSILFSSSLPYDPVRYNFYYLSLIAMHHSKKKSNLAEKMFYETLQIVLYKLLTKPDIQAREACQRTAGLINDVFRGSGLGLKTLKPKDIDNALNAAS